MPEFSVPIIVGNIPLELRLMNEIKSFSFKVHLFSTWRKGYNFDRHFHLPLRCVLG